MSLNSHTVRAFCHEMTKMAVSVRDVGGALAGAGRAALSHAGQGAKQLLHEGWHGTAQNPMSWMGQGRLTRYLPVGGKSLFVLGTAPQLGTAFSERDVTGQGRTRSERLTGLAGNVLGGMMGSSAVMRTAFGARHPLLAGAIGGIGGGILGEKVLASPFSHARKAEQQRLFSQAQQGYGGY